jgi:hypothetical protein
MSTPLCLSSLTIQLNFVVFLNRFFGFACGIRLTYLDGDPSIIWFNGKASGNPSGSKPTQFLDIGLGVFGFSLDVFWQCCSI